MIFSQERSLAHSHAPSLRLATAITFSLLVGFAAVIAVEIAFEFQRASQSRTLLNQSFETRSQTQSVFSLLQDAETGQRGFIITGDPAFLEPYERSVERLDEQMRRLGQLLIGDEEQLAHLNSLMDLAAAKLAEMSRGIEARREDRAAEAMEIVASGRGKALMDQIRQIVTQMTTAEAAAVAVQLRDTEDRSSRAAWYTMLAVFGSLIVTVTASILVLSHLKRRRQAEDTLRQQERLVELMKGIAEDANAAKDFDDALTRSFRGFERSLEPQKGLAVRLDPVSGGPTALAWHPADGEAPDLHSAAEALAPEWAGRTVALAGSTDELSDVRSLNIVVRDVERPVGFLRLEGLDHRLTEEALVAAARYAASQLAQAAERGRISTSLNDTLARHEAVFQSAIDGIVTLNTSGSIETFNPAAERLFGVKAEDVLRRHFSRLIEADDEQLALLTGSMREDARGHGGIRELVGRRGDGITFPMDVATSVMRLGERRLFLAIVRDVSERKRIEQMKNEFVSTVSHELRTPLTSIAGSLGLLAGGAAGALPERARKLIGIAHGNSQRLVRLINDILDIEKIESGRMPFDLKPVSLLAVVDQTVEANRGFAENYDVGISKGEVQGTVLADADRLAQVITNLLSNAIKFSPPGENVHISAVASGGGYRLSVRDRGPGIPEEFRARMFTKFAQADSTDTRQKGGTGLGLSIVKEIVIRLGGTISFEDVSGGGTVFHVDLPRLRELDQPIRHGDAKSAVLVAESKPDAARALEEALSRAGFYTDRASSASDARVLVASRRYAAILLDIELSGGNGVGLVQEMRAAEPNVDTLIFVVSTDPSSGAGTDASGGVALLDWLHKPADADRLISGLIEPLRNGAEGRPRILHVDDDPDVLQVVAAAFGPRARLFSADSLHTAQAALEAERFDLVILDLGLADGSGLELLPRLKRDGATMPVVVFSAQDADPDLAQQVDATLTKSRATLDTLVETVEALVGERQRRA